MFWSFLAACTNDPAPAPLDRPIAAKAERPDAARTDAGLVVTWTERTDDANIAWLQAIPDTGGLPEAILLPAERPVSGLARKPQVHSDGQRVAVVWSAGDPRSSEVTLALADSPTGPYRPRTLALGAANNPVTLVDQPDVRFAPDGELWTTWKTEVDHPRVQLVLGREKEGFAGISVDPFPGTPCECCPHVLDFSPRGDVLLSIRNNVQNLREIHLARADAGTLDFEQQTAVSSTGWVVQGCPFDGPTMAILSEDDIAIAWVDPTSGTSQAWVARSVDGGATWSPAEAPLVDADAIFRTPSLTHNNGVLGLAVEDAWTGIRVVVDRGAGWSEVPLPRALFDGELVASPKGFTLVGVDVDGQLWAVPITDEG